MVPLFLTLTLANLIGLCLAVVVGYAGTANYHLVGVHMILGALVAMLCCLVHSVVFTYFIVSGKWVELMVANKKLNPELPGIARKYKSQAFPAALIAISSVFIAAAFGAAAAKGMLALRWHALASFVALLLNIAAAVFESSSISRNAQLLKSMVEKIATLPPVDPAATPVEKT